MGGGGVKKTIHDYSRPPQPEKEKNCVGKEKKKSLGRQTVNKHTHTNEHYRKKVSQIKKWENEN